MVAKALSTTLVGINGVRVDVEAHIVGSLNRFSIVGLPDSALREAKDRVRCAIENSGFDFPWGQLVVSLGPAALPKQGAGFDLAIALSVLAAAGIIEHNTLEGRVILGELALDGRVKPVAGALQAASHVAENGLRELLLPAENAGQATLIPRTRIVPVHSLQQAVAYLRGSISLEAFHNSTPNQLPSQTISPSFRDVVGQYAAKRALEIVAAGGHNILMLGPPGGGKSMLAKRLISILPPLEHDEIIDVTKVFAAVANRDDQQRNRRSVIATRPFRTPHHTTSTAGLVGGGSYPRPGEISLAHRGVLFLDELSEFRRDAIEALREPLETGEVTVCRAKQIVSFPAEFMLVAATNPCPCGKRGAAPSACRCTPPAIERYMNKLSGPFMDRIDLHLWISPVEIRELNAGAADDPTERMRENVLHARMVQTKRFGTSRYTNATMTAEQIKEYCALEAPARTTLERAATQLHLSARGYSRVMKLSRTIADIDDCATISEAHLKEALSYRAIEHQEK